MPKMCKISYDLQHYQRLFNEVTLTTDRCNG